MRCSPTFLDRRLRWWAGAAGFGLFLGLVPVLPAAVIGTNSPVQPLTAERIAALPRSQQSAWKDYLKRSNRQAQVDENFLPSEMRKHGITNLTLAPSGHSARSLPLHNPDSWYGESEARRIADIVVSFQTPAGGWSKNLDMTNHPRAPGESFTTTNRSRFPGRADFDLTPANRGDYVGTFDNNATTTQLRFLAKVITAGTNQPTAYRKAFLRGLDYIFAAQYPNGGWPQVWPLQGGYHDAITYNDDAMLNVLALLRDISATNRDFGFVPKKYRARAAASFQRGLACVLATQIVVDGRRTVWCQQHDPLTLQPVSARNFEMPSQAGGESANLALFLMEQPAPGPEIVASVNAAAAWFEKAKIYGLAYKFDQDKKRRLIAAPDSGPIWARDYQIGTDRPIFGDRDKSIHDDVNEISEERRNGYSWYNDGPERMLERYADWKKVHAS
jgi:PelA/Pel-15E family pectate lyase